MNGWIGGGCHSWSSVIKSLLIVFTCLGFIGVIFTRIKPQRVRIVSIPQQHDELVNMKKSELESVAVNALFDVDLHNEHVNPVQLRKLVTSAPIKQPKKEPAAVNVKSSNGAKGNAADELHVIHSFLYEYKDNPKIRKAGNVKIKACPAIPPNLVGPIKVFQNNFPLPSLNSLDFRASPGGSYVPEDCVPRQKVAIIIPYRNREKHLSILLLNLHPFLQKQQLEYTIFVINQIQGSKFNRGMLMNVGFVEAEKRKKYDCVIFHDVDLLPENDKNIYNCPEDAPRHMSVAIDKFEYQLPYKSIMGGVVAIGWQHFVKANGYSNQFFGWGGEDDDFSRRCKQIGLIITRYPAAIARYQMIKHETDTGNEANPRRFEMLKSVDDRQWRDGLNSLTYKIKSIEERSLFTLINVGINQTLVMNAEPTKRVKFPFE